MSSPEEAPAVVLDTNVVLDWLVFRDTAVSKLVTAIELGQVRWLATLRMRTELNAVLAHGHLDRWLPDSEYTLTTFDRWAQMRPDPGLSPLPCRDPDDQPFIDLALAERARWLVTRDRALLDLARRGRIRSLAIVTPAMCRDAIFDQPQAPAPSIA